MKELKTIIKFLEAHDIEAWISGGTARDVFLDRSYEEIHVSVRATFSTLNKLFKDRLVKLDKVGNYFSIKYNENVYLLHPLTKIKVTNTYPSYLPTDNLEEDAKSRDFTINTLYYNPSTNSWIDYFGAKEDCKNKSIKLVGNPQENILASKIRLLRGPVLCGLLGEGWKLDYTTSVAIKDYSLKLMAVTRAELHNEFQKLFTRTKKPSKTFNILRQTNLLVSIFPELLLTIGVDQSNKRDHLDLYTHIMYALDSIPESANNLETLRLSALLHDIAKPQTEVISKEGRHFFNHEIVGKKLCKIVLDRWGYSSKVQKNVSHLVEHHLFNLTASHSKTALKKFISRVTPDLIHTLLDLRVADIMGAGISKSTFPVESLRRKINNELMKTSPKDFKLAISTTDIEKIIKDDTEEDLLNETVEACQTFLKNKIFLGRTHNKKTNLKKALNTINKIICPLDKKHLFDTWSQIQTGHTDTFENGKLKCGVYCNFNCDKKLRK